MLSGPRARGSQTARIASGEERERALARFLDAVRELSDDPSAVTVFRHLRCSIELDTTRGVAAERSEQTASAAAQRPSTRRGHPVTLAS
jgi:hypothetical protein